MIEAGRPGAAADVAQGLPRDVAVDVAVGETGAAEKMAAHGQAGKIALAGVGKGEMQAVGGDAYQRTRGMAKGSVHQLAEAEEEGRAGNEQEENAWQAGRLAVGRDGQAGETGAEDEGEADTEVAFGDGVRVFVPLAVAGVGGGRNVIAIPRKPHTVLRRLAVQPRTVFGDAPCLKLSVDGYSVRRQVLDVVGDLLKDARQVVVGNGEGVALAMAGRRGGEGDGGERAGVRWCARRRPGAGGGEVKLQAAAANAVQQRAGDGDFRSILLAAESTITIVHAEAVRIADERGRMTEVQTKRVMAEEQGERQAGVPEVGFIGVEGVAVHADGGLVQDEPGEDQRRRDKQSRCAGMVAVLVVPDAGGGVVAVGDEAGNHGGWGVMLSETAGARGIHGAFRGGDVMALFDGAVFVQQQPFVGGRHDDSAVFQGDDFLYPGGACLQVAGRGGVFRLQQDERVVAVRIMVRAARVEGCAVGRPGQADQCGVFSGMSRRQGLADVQRANGAEVYHVFLADGAVGGEGEVLAVGMQGEGAGGACGMDFGGNGAVCLVEAQAVRPPVHTGKGEGKQVVVRSEGAIGDDVAVVVVAKKRGAFAVGHAA